MDNVELFAFFCEDVRDELGNKQSYMGVLNDEVVFPPGTKRIKGLVAVGVARIRGRREITAEMTVRVPGRDEPLILPSQTLTAPEGSSAWTVNLNANLNNMTVADGFAMRVTFVVGDVTAEANVMMRVTPEAEPQLEL